MLTRIGYVGILVPLAILNIGEGTVEGFVKPYLAHHGGIPADDLPGLMAYEAPALLVMLVGMVCLGIAVLRARVLPRWVGVLFLVVPFLGAAGLQGASRCCPTTCCSSPCSRWVSPSCAGPGPRAGRGPRLTRME